MSRWELSVGHTVALAAMETVVFERGALLMWLAYALLSLIIM